MDTLKIIIQELEKNPLILFSYLYGSQARGENREDSDIDVAVYLSRESEDPFLASNIALDLEKKIGREVDIRIINSAPIVFIHQVLKQGKLLFSRDEKVRINFESRKMGEYLDFKPILKQYDERRLERYGIR